MISGKSIGKAIALVGIGILIVGVTGIFVTGAHGLAGVGFLFITLFIGLPTIAIGTVVYIISRIME